MSCSPARSPPTPGADLHLVLSGGVAQAEGFADGPHRRLAPSAAASCTAWAASPGRSRRAGRRPGVGVPSTYEGFGIAVLKRSLPVRRSSPQGGVPCGARRSRAARRSRPRGLGRGAGGEVAAAPPRAGRLVAAGRARAAHATTRRNGRAPRSSTPGDGSRHEHPRAVPALCARCSAYRRGDDRHRHRAVPARPQLHVVTALPAVRAPPGGLERPAPAP